MIRSSPIERLAYWVALILLCWGLLTFLVWPILSALHTALVRDGAVALGTAISELAASRRVRLAVWNTLWMTGATTVTVATLGLFQVLVLEYLHVRGRVFLKIAFAIPLVFGSVVAASGYAFAYGPGGVVTTALRQVFPGLPADWFIGWFGVLFIHTFLMTSFYFLFLRVAMRRVDYSTIEAARSLGASEWTILRRVVLPVIAPTFLAVLVLTVFVAISSFAAPRILGGRDFFMLTEVILTLNSLRRPDMAALLAILMGTVLMGLILLFQSIEARGSYVGGAKTPVPIQLRRLTSRGWNIALHGACYVLAFLYLLPVALVVLFSFAPAASIGVESLPSSLTLRNYIRVFTEATAFAPFWTSTRLALIAVAVGLVATLFAVPVMLSARTIWTRALDLVFFLPWVLPSVLLAVGLIAAFDTPNLLIGGGVLLGSFWILPIGYTIVILPLLVRFLRAAFVGIDPDYDQAARSLGAARLYRFRRVVFPLILPTAVLVSGMAFNDLMTEYPLSAFLYNVNNTPLPIAIVEGAMSPDPEQRALNLVYSVLIMGFSLAVILLAERIGLGQGPKINRP